MLVLGATGHLGRAACAALRKSGCSVRGLARGPGPNTRAQASVTWHYADMARLTAAGDWQDVLSGCCAVVNLAGALQDGGRDNLEAIHDSAIAALVAACNRGVLIVHVSAPGVNHQATTAFYRTKANGDDHVRNSGKPFVILRPAVVIGPESYGGSALLRALAACPGFIPAVLADRRMQTVSIDDVVDAICQAVSGALPPGSDIVLAEPSGHLLADVLVAFRQWLGLPPAPVVKVPWFAARVASQLADLAGMLGWRSPLRITALRVASENVTGTPGLSCRSLDETLSSMPSTVSDRWFARLYLLKPVAILTLALFWLGSGAIGIWQMDAAATTLIGAGLAVPLAKASVMIGAAADLLLGAFVLHHRTARAALLGMIVLTLAYLVAATAVTPSLWLDPLGPLVKAIPSLTLTLLTLAILPER